MKRQDCAVDMGVVYRPFPEAVPEDGVVTELRDGGAMVRYSTMGSAKLTRYEDLEPLKPEVVKTVPLRLEDFMPKPTGPTMADLDRERQRIKDQVDKHLVRIVNTLRAGGGGSCDTIASYCELPVWMVWRIGHDAGLLNESEEGRYQRWQELQRERAEREDLSLTRREKER